MKPIFASLRRLAVGLGAITAASAALLVADLGSRRAAAQAAAAASHVARIALVQHASIEPLDEGVRGIVDALARRGFRDGAEATIARYNAQGDIATSSTIAKQVVASPLDLVVTVSTISLQTVAGANRSQTEPKRHVFGITTDPFGAGIGISKANPLEHPPYMVGLGTPPLVRELFELLRQIKPDVRRIGLVWNPAEANSEAATRLARTVIADLGWTLVEGNADSSTAAGEVARSVLSRGVDALWISPDITVITAAKSLIEAAQRAGVPVVASLPKLTAQGALLGLGASFYDLGYVQGELAADLLDGRDPATIPVVNWTPETLHVNLEAAKGLRDRWDLSDAIVRRASVVIDAAGTRVVDLPKPKPPAALQWQRSGK